MSDARSEPEAVDGATSLVADVKREGGSEADAVVSPAPSVEAQPSESSAGGADGNKEEIGEPSKEKVKEGIIKLAQITNTPIINSIQLGGSRTSEFNYFNGFIRNFSLYNRALSHPEITVTTGNLNSNTSGSVNRLFVI